MTTKMTTAAGLGDVTAWILAKHTERSSIGPDEDLIVNRLIDSLSFVEFVFVIEQVSGADIYVENIDLEQFRTIRAIEKAFFK